MTIDGNSSYIVDGSTSILARYTQENNRVFYKETSGRCVRVCAYPSNTGYSGCVLLSTNPDDVAYYLMVPNKLLFSEHHPAITVDGISWYVSHFAGWCAGNNCRNIDGYPEIDITKYPTFPTYGDGSQSPTPQFLTELESFVREILTAGNIQIVYNANGGGATHIAKVTGQLKDLSSNLSDILMVSGGGGGGMLVNTTEYTGKEAGGISGSGDNSADQTTGNAFGQGESGTNVSGGGSGLYGGYKGTSSKSGGAGSGYIGNSLVNNKKMVGYNVPTSSAEGTKTESVNDVSASAVSGKPKSGNGFARIKFLRDAHEYTILKNNTYNYDVLKDGVDIQNNRSTYAKPSGMVRQSDVNSNLSQDIGSNKTLCVYMQYGGSQALYSLSDGLFIRRPSMYENIGIHTCIPIKRILNPKKLVWSHKNYANGNGNNHGYVGLAYIRDNEIVEVINRSENNNTTGSYVTVTTLINNIDYVDYLIIHWASGAEDLKDISIIGG